MNIVIMADALHSVAAGSERQIYKLISGLCDQGHNVKLALLRHTAFTQDLTEFPCPIVCLNIRSVVSLQAFQALRNFRAQLISWKIQALHAWLPESCLLAPLFLKHATMQVITSRRDMGLIYKGKPAWLYRAVKNRADAIVSNSQAVADYIQQCEHLPPERCKVIYNGLDAYTAPSSVSEIVFKNASAIKVILVANIKPVKRTLDAVNAIIQLNAQGLLTEIALIGEPQDQNYVAAIKNQIAASQAGDFVHWLGSIHEPRRLLPQADIGLLVSDSEGLSNTLMEYMQAGLPIIATNVGGNPELIEHQRNGLLIDKGDVSALVAAIRYLVEQQAQRESYSRISQQRIQTEFSLESMVHQHLALYGVSRSDVPDFSDKTPHDPKGKAVKKEQVKC